MSTRKFRLSSRKCHRNKREGNIDETEDSTLTVSIQLSLLSRTPVLQKFMPPQPVTPLTISLPISCHESVQSLLSPKPVVCDLNMSLFFHNSPIDSVQSLECRIKTSNLLSSSM